LYATVAIFQQYLKLQPVATQSQVPLSKQIPERYSTVLEIREDSGIVDFKADAFKEYLEKDAKDAPNRPPAPTFQEAEVSLVKKLLKTHLYNTTGSHDTFDRFGFETFFEDKGKPQSTTIHLVSESDRALRTTMACLVAICDMSGNNEYSELQDYAWEYFGYHVEEIQIDQADAQRLQEIGRRVVRILYDADMIDTWLNKRPLKELEDEWVRGTFPTDAVFKFLSDDKVQAGLASMPSESKWVLSTTSTKGPSVRILEHVAKRMARRWLSDGDHEAMSWLDGFLRTVSVSGLPLMAPDLHAVQLNGETPQEEMTYERICQVEAWSRKALGTSEAEAEIHSAVAATCEQHGLWKHAVARYRDAVACAPENLEYRLGLSRALGRSGKKRLAIEIWEHIVTGHYERIMSDEVFKDQVLVLILDHLCRLVEQSHVGLHLFHKTKEIYTKLLFESWKQHFKLARALLENNEPKEAANMLQDLLNRQQDRVIADESYRSVHWGEIIPLHIYALYENKDYGQAETYCRQLIDEGRKRGEFGYSVKRVIYTNIMVLCDQDRHADVIRLMESFDNDQDRYIESRLIEFLLEFAEQDRFHERIFAAARQSGNIHFVELAYNSAIRTVRKDPSRTGVSLLLQSYLAAFDYSRGTPAQRKAAMDTWDRIVHAQTSPGDASLELIAQARHDAANKLAASLFDLAKKGEESYMVQLQQLAKHEKSDAMVGAKSPQVLLGRLYQIQGKFDLARQALRDVVKHAFLTIEAGDGDGRYRLIMALQAVDDETNALAVWRTYNPRKPSRVRDPAAPKDAEPSQDQPGNHEPVADVERMTQLPVSDAEAGASPDDHLVRRIESSDSANFTGTVVEAKDSANDVANTADAGSDSDNEATDGSKDESHPEIPEKLEGDLNNSCDGHCGITWTYTGEVDGVYCCKDCYDVQFCPDCFAKLKAGTLMRSICDPDHSHMKLPSFDKQRWETKQEDDMWVDDELVSKSDWVQRVKAEWRLDEESVKAREKTLDAVVVIQRVWRTQFKLKRKKAVGGDVDNQKNPQPTTLAI
jgi:tetratricopeptide (TPR) repeat protein